eukprot:TRINITY_DN31317_c0_g1_i1.p1 TRINITY_DN31317_c0_g1~~TRINITY_DN31317_c0_g1_i1.p1  ORF type:complete len:175 (-),score=31.94 TRINITY_DN31317_c0_g1_i1:184-636(-)
MEQRVSLISLGVADMERSAAFYGALGWQRVETTDGLVVFDLIGQTLGLYPKDKMFADIGIPPPSSDSGFSGITLGYNVREKKEVAEVLDKAKAAGGKVLKEAADVFWGGHHGFFADLDGHLWEVAHNPYSALRADGAFRWNGYAEEAEKK